MHVSTGSRYFEIKNTTTMSLDNSIILLTLILALTHICERITNMFKLYLPEKWVSSFKSNNKIAEKKREKKIILISLIAGLTTSFIFFISCPENEFTKLLIPDYWLKETLLIILVGILLSFGSKFWHDILDIVLSIKSLKQTDADEKANLLEEKESISGSDRFKKLSNEEQRKLISDFISDNSGNLLKDYPEIQNVSARIKSIYGIAQNYYSIHFSMIEKAEHVAPAKAIPPFFDYIWKNKIKYSIPTDIEGVGKNELLEGQNMSFKLGETCSRKAYNNFGTIGLKVYKNNIPYLLSCYHVLCKPELVEGKMRYDSNNNSTYNKSVVSPGKANNPDGKIIGEIEEGVIDALVDAAIAKLSSDEILENDYYGGYGAPSYRRDLNSEDTTNKIDLFLIGNKRMKPGKLINHYNSVTKFDYEFQLPSKQKVTHLFSGLISTTIKSIPGDSGSAVYDKELNVVGILLGGNEKESFVIPISKIFDTFHLDYNKLKLYKL